MIDFVNQPITNCHSTNHYSTTLQTADRPGFEPGAQGYPCVGLANRWFQPLTHLSKLGRKYIATFFFSQSLSENFSILFFQTAWNSQTYAHLKKFQKPEKRPKNASFAAFCYICPRTINRKHHV